MEKRQTFIAFIYNDLGKQLTFERFSCKRIGTVEKQLKKLLHDDLYKACVMEKGQKTAIIKIYETPNGVDALESPSLTFTEKIS